MTSDAAPGEPAPPVSAESLPEAAPTARARHWVFAVPVVAFGLIAVGFYFGLGADMKTLPSALIDEPAPQFELPALPGHRQGFATADLTGHVSLVNTFASWCTPCREEHPVLNALAATQRVPIFGINYKDKPDSAVAWLETLGDPYAAIGMDDGRVGLDWGVYGVPETFVVDRNGRVRYKHVGPLTRRDIERTILPLVAQLEK